MTFQPKYLFWDVLKLMQFFLNGFWCVDKHYVPVMVVASLTSTAFKY